MKSCLSRILELHEWELKSIPFFDSIIGRHVYVCLARFILKGDPRHSNELSIKALLKTSHFTDRAIRLKLREMEEAGFIHCELGSSDKRMRIIRPTEKTIKLIEKHSTMMCNSISLDYHLIEKQ